MNSVKFGAGLGLAAAFSISAAPALAGFDSPFTYDGPSLAPTEMTPRPRTRPAAEGQE